LVSSINDEERVKSQKNKIGICLTESFFVLGYGKIVPKTVQGRLFCVLYSLIGIPGTCLTLKGIGDKITKLFTELIITFENRLLKKKKRPEKVELKAALTTIFLTVIFLLPLMALFSGAHGRSPPAQHHRQATLATYRSEKFWL